MRSAFMRIANTGGVTLYRTDASQAKFRKPAYSEQYRSVAHQNVTSGAIPPAAHVSPHLGIATKRSILRIASNQGPQSKQRGKEPLCSGGCCQHKHLLTKGVRAAVPMQLQQCTKRTCNSRGSPLHMQKHATGLVPRPPTAPSMSPFAASSLRRQYRISARFHLRTCTANTSPTTKEQVPPTLCSICTAVVRCISPNPGSRAERWQGIAREPKGTRWQM